jgi:hypothetical protein
LIYNKYLSYKERKRKEKIYHSKKAHKYNRKQAAFHADGTPMTEEERQEQIARLRNMPFPSNFTFNETTYMWEENPV